MHLIVTRAFPPELGGMQSLMWGLTKEMSKNFMIKVFADYQENHKEFDKKENFSIERVGGIKFLRKIRKAQLINEYLKENKVKGIIADHWKSLELIKTDKKKYCLIHGKEINHPLGSLINKRVKKVLNNVEKIIANSEYTKNLAIEKGIDPKKLVVINPGVDPVEEPNKKSLEKVESLLKIKTPRLITVSRFDKRKNHEKVIMALRNLKQKYPDIVYICIGYGDEEENLKNLVQELDLGSQVMFFKDITKDLKNSLVAKSDIFVMPSIIHKTSVEGFGIAYVEAAQYGVPSLGGKDGGASDAIDHNKTGLICDGNNLDEIYTSLDDMLENKKYLELGKNAKEFVSKFQWEKILVEYKKIFELNLS
jgi:phosphatidylinositol alpha-1,6-mannosyltransferase